MNTGSPRSQRDAGVKVADYGMDLTQFADNGKTVGSLGGAPYVTHSANYRSWMPSIDARYKMKSNWTAYAQFATGSIIPPSSVFDSKGAQVAVLPKPDPVKTYQAGSVVKFNRWTLDLDAYYSHFQNPYSSSSTRPRASPSFTRPARRTPRAWKPRAIF